MRGPIRSVLLAALAACAFAVAAVGSASAALMKTSVAGSAFQAIYGKPPTTGPLGGGLGMNFGFGENLLFTANATAPRERLSITIGTGEGAVVAKSEESEVGGTLMSNSTGKGFPLSLSVQFVDLQHSTAPGTTATPTYADTSDRPWIAEICAPAATTCRTEPRFVAAGGQVHVQDVSIQLLPGGVPLTIQGDLWGTWTNGTATEPACIKLTLPPASATASETLIVTKTGVGLPAVGTTISAITGKLCLLSANNDYYVGNTPAVELLDE